MQAKMQRTSSATVAVAATTALLLVLFAAWFMVIAPKRTEAADLERQIDATRVLLAAKAREPAEPASDPEAQLARLNTAVPESVQMSSVVLELNRIAGRALVRIDEFAPAAPVAQAGYQTQPITVTLQGTFFAISDFLRLLRAEADIRRGEIVGAGRIYSVDSLSFAEGASKYPILAATLTISTVFGATAAAPQSGSGEVVNPGAASAAAGQGSQ